MKRRRKRREIYYRVLNVQENGHVTLGVYVLETEKLRSPLTGRHLGETQRLVQIRTEVWSPGSPGDMVSWEDQLPER